MEYKEEERTDDDDERWNCDNAEIKDYLDSAISAVWEDNHDRVTRERFHFILQVLLNDPEFLLTKK